MMYGFNGHGMAMGWGWLVGLVILIAAIWLIVRTVNQNPANQSSGKSALDILKERYARGEISKEEYHEKRNDIE